MAMISNIPTDSHEPQSGPPRAWDHTLDRSALDHATRLIHRVCCLAGEPDLIDEIRSDNATIRSAITDHDSAALFDWLMIILSEIAPELTGHGLPLSKCEAYNRVYDQFYQSR